jgi:predicted acyltransferase
MRKYGHELNSGSIFRILRRTVTIFLVGLLLSIFPYFFDRDYSQLRIMGVLQRIALAYGIGALLCLAIRREYLWIVVALILLAYWALLAFFGDADPYSLEGNFARKVDLAILGANHLYKGFGVPFDPEGLLSTLPAAVNVIIGFYTGHILGKKRAEAIDALKLLLFGAAAVGLGLLWSLVFPLNKPLWTSSYVLYTSGLAMGFLAFIYLVSDVFQFQGWGKFFMVFGTNALFSFFLAGIWTKTMLYLITIPSGDNRQSLYSWIYEKICVPVAGDLNGSLLFGLLQVLFIWLIVLVLYRKKIFIRL